MGSKTWMLVYSNGDPSHGLRASDGLNRSDSLEMAHALFPGSDLEPLADGSLSWTNPPQDEILIGCYGDVSVIAAREFAGDRPSTLDRRFIDAAAGQTVHLHAMHSGVNWLAFARWDAGRLTRSLSLSTDDGVIEDRGAKLAFETEFWNGSQPIFDPTDDLVTQLGFNFHPLSLGEAALRSFFGYQLEGFVDPSLLAPGGFPLLRFKRTSDSDTLSKPAISPEVLSKIKVSMTAVSPE